MGIISEVKCSRCDRRYSGLRSRCPYCGARRSSRGKRAPNGDNSTWKLVIGILLLLVLIVAVIVLIFTSLADKDHTPSNSPTYNPNDGVTDQPGTDVITTPPVVTSPPVVTTPPVLGIDNIRIMLWGDQKTDITINVGDVFDMEYETVPANYEGTPEWSCDNETILVITQSGKITAIAPGTTTIRVALDGVIAECIVRIN